MFPPLVWYAVMAFDGKLMSRRIKTFEPAVEGRT